MVIDHHHHNHTCPSVSWPLGGTRACWASLPPAPLFDPVGDLMIMIIIVIISIIIIIMIIMMSSSSSFYWS